MSIVLAVIKNIAIAGFFIAQIATIATTSNAQVNESDLLNRKATVIRKDANIYEILRILSLQTNVPIGFEALPDEFSRRHGQKLSIEIRKGTVHEVLNYIVQADNRYQWNTTNGVIEVTPKENECSILNVMVHNFVVEDTRIEEVGFSITSNPAVRAKLQSMGLIDSQLITYRGEPRLQATVSFALPDMTVREILNEMIKRSYINSWSVIRYGAKNNFIRIQLM